MESDALRENQSQIGKAERLLALHHGAPLLLPNAWDAMSARLFEAAGYAAVATTSGGIAWSLGHPDGESLSRQEMVDAVRRIARSVSVPVTADIEAGFGASPAEVGETVRLIVEAGAVGINLEDHLPGEGGGMLDMGAAAERIRAARLAAGEVPLVINARVDVFLHGGLPLGEQVGEAVHRAQAYVQAGADCIYPIGVSDPTTIAVLAFAIGAPINVWARAGMPDVQELGRLGVARISMATAPCLAAMSALGAIASQVLESGRFDSLSPRLAYQDMQTLFAPR